MPAPRTPRAEARKALGLPPDRPVAVSLGVVTPAKRIGKVLEALAVLEPSERPFFFVGGAVGSDDPLRAAVARLGLREDVAFGGYLSEDDFWRAASAADLAVNLRHPTMGETSGAVCRLVGFGLPTVVSDVGWFRELPDAFASKIPVGEKEVPSLTREILRLLSDPEDLGRRAAHALAWGAERSPARTAGLYADVLSAAALGWTAPLAVQGLVAGELFALGVGAAGRFGATSRASDADALLSVARACAGVLPSRRATGG